MWRNGSTLTLLVKIYISRVSMENNMEIPQKLKIGLLYDPPAPLLTKEKSQKLKVMSTCHACYSYIHSSQDMKTIKCVSELTDKRYLFLFVSLFPI